MSAMADQNNEDITGVFDKSAVKYLNIKDDIHYTA
jgi:hypothetical protein